MFLRTLTVVLTVCLSALPAWAQVSVTKVQTPSGATTWAVVVALTMIICVVVANMWSSKRGHRD